MKHRLAVIASFGILTISARAQGQVKQVAKSVLISAPVPQNTFALAMTAAHPPQTQSDAPTDTTSTIQLTLKQAEALAIKQNPQISVGRLSALAARQVTREARSALWPTSSVDLTAVDARDNSRITAGGLNNPIIYDRAAAGANVSQLITDFGHTSNLVSSASYAAKAENQNAMATQQQILLAVDQAFYGALQAQALLTVAQQTVSARQTVTDQVQALFDNKLKSQLDLSFANVNLAQAKLLLLDGENNQKSALATLSSILGYDNLQNFALVEDGETAVAPPASINDLIAQALNLRPEIRALDFQFKAAEKFHNAERDQLLPSIRALGAIGDTPVRDPVLSNWYATAGVNMDIPVFNGFLYPAQSREAKLREQAAQERLRDLRNRISRDVRSSWLNANTAYQRLSVTQQLLDQANLALSLAETRYKLGLSSIVELSQAQLQQTQAQISGAQAGYDYRLALAVLRYQTTGI
jgi:outer membrane protein